MWRAFVGEGQFFGRTWLAALRAKLCPGHSCSDWCTPSEQFRPFLWKEAANGRSPNGCLPVTLWTLEGGLATLGSCGSRSSSVSRFHFSPGRVRHRGKAGGGEREGGRKAPRKAHRARCLAGSPGCVGKSPQRRALGGRGASLRPRPRALPPRLRSADSPTLSSPAWLPRSLPPAAPSLSLSPSRRVSPSSRGLLPSLFFAGPF